MPTVISGIVADLRWKISRSACFTTRRSPTCRRTPLSSTNNLNPREHPHSGSSTPANATEADAYGPGKAALGATGSTRPTPRRSRLYLA